MTIYDQSFKSGEIWMRAPNGERYPANQVLSAIYVKYDTVSQSFYKDLTSNNLINFDIIYDTLFLTSTAGCIFEKFYVENGTIQPHNQSNLFYPICSTQIDYWFSEPKNKIYYTDVLDIYKAYTPYNSLTSLRLFITFNIFDCELGITTTKNIYQMTLQPGSGADWISSNYTIETPKITYNTDSYIFNISFLLKNHKKQLGIVSLNIKDNEEYDVTECNTFLPYFNLSKQNSSVQKTSYNNIPKI